MFFTAPLPSHIHSERNHVSTKQTYKVDLLYYLVPAHRVVNGVILPVMLPYQVWVQRSQVKKAKSAMHDRHLCFCLWWARRRSDLSTVGTHCSYCRSMSNPRCQDHRAISYNFVLLAVSPLFGSEADFATLPLRFSVHGIIVWIFFPVPKYVDTHSVQESVRCFPVVCPFCPVQVLFEISYWYLTNICSLIVY
ncbi:hypothetical protein ACQJBY_008528 [Aegilops geniculata]